MNSSRRGLDNSQVRPPQLEPLEARRMLDATGLFDPIVSETVGVNARAVALADLNGNGHLDMALAHGGGLVVRLNDGAGSFTTGDTHELSPGLNRLAIADLNGDGILDIAASTTSSGGARIFLGNGDGTFTFSSSIELGAIPTDILAVDMDGDGDLDLLVPTLTGSATHILHNDGEGNFSVHPFTIPGASFPMSVAAGDFANDGRLGVATSGLGDSQVVISYEFPAVPGAWMQEAAYAVGAQPQVLAAGDFNGDGFIDLLTGDQFGTGLALLMNNGDGTFADYVPLSTSNPIGCIVIADVNYDGKPDIIAGGLGATQVQVLLGNGDGTFESATALATGFSVDYLAVGDVDGSGFVDIVAVGHGKVGSLLNTRQAPAAPLKVELAPESDRGFADDDNLTNLNNSPGSELSFIVSAVEIGAIVRVYAGDTLIAEALANAATLTLTGNGVALADGYHSIKAAQVDPFSGIESALSPGFTLAIDTVPPVFTSPASAAAVADSLFTFNIESDAETQGGQYELVSGPAGLTLSPTTGVLSWNASMLQLGQQQVIVRIGDAAGNVAEQTITISVAGGAERPDVISALDLSRVFDTLVPGDNKAQAIVHLGNQGNGEARGSVTITVYASLDTTLGPGDIVLGQLTRNVRLNPGQVRGFNVRLLVPGDIPAGSYHLIADVDTSTIPNERRPENDDSIAPATTNVAWRFGSFEGRSNVRLTVPSAGGAAVTFRLNGQGYGEISGGSNFTTITVVGASNDTLRIQAAGNALVTLNDLNIDGSLSAFRAPSALITGTLNATGSIARVQWQSITGIVNAAGIGNLRLGGDSLGTWNIAGSGLDVARIDGSISAGGFNVGTGLTKNLRVMGSVAAAATLSFNELGNANIRGNLLGDLTASSINKLVIGGQWSGLVRATQTASEGMRVLTVKGATLNATLDAIGGIGKATLADAVNVSLYAGVDTSLLATIGDLPAGFVNNAAIGNLRVRGTTSGGTISAPHLDRVTFGPVAPLGTLKISASSANRVQMILDGSRHRFTGSELFEQTPALPYLVVEQV